MNNKEKIAYVGLATSLLFGGAACFTKDGKIVKGVGLITESPATPVPPVAEPTAKKAEATATTVPTASKPVENGAVTFSPEQFATMTALLNRTDVVGGNSYTITISNSASAIANSSANTAANAASASESAAKPVEPVATAVPAIPKVDNYWETPYSKTAVKSGGSWVLHNSDGAEVKMNLDGAIGFTPDADLKISDINPKALGTVPADAGDFQAYLNKPREGFGPLAGFTDGTNDYNQYYNQESGPQLPVYSWMVHTGLDVELPGIGRVVGGPGRAVMVLMLNRTERVYRFPSNSVKVVAGFQGFGRIWDGNSNTVAETEKRLDNHYRSRLGQGVPETGFIGQCDLTNNCNNVTIVAVERIQWGNNSDGTPRDQFRLLRAETISAK